MTRTFLTPREREVLRLTANGLTSKEVATLLGISPRTADVHRARLMHKLGLRNRVEVARYALMNSGVVPSSPEGSGHRLPFRFVDE
jgi:DNA-binding CsgD family transcriptional regulator